MFVQIIFMRDVNIFLHGKPPQLREK